MEVYDHARYFCVTGRLWPGSPSEVTDCQEQLDDLCRQHWGQQPSGAKPAPQPSHGSASSPQTTTHPDDRVGRCLAAMLKMKVADKSDGSHRLFAAACRVVEYDLSDADGVAAIRRYAQQRPFPTDWSDQQIIDRIHDAEKKTQRGKKCNGLASSPVPPPPSPKGLPLILVGNVQLSDLTTQGLGAIKHANVPPVVFVRTGSLCRVIRDEDGQPIIDRIDKIKARARLAKVAEFYAMNKRGNYIGTIPPLYLAENILAQGSWDFPPLTGVARSPILRPGGTICTTFGYDACPAFTTALTLVW